MNVLIEGTVTLEKLSKAKTRKHQNKCIVKYILKPTIYFLNHLKGLLAYTF